MSLEGFYNSEGPWDLGDSAAVLGVLGSFHKAQDNVFCLLYSPALYLDSREMPRTWSSPILTPCAAGRSCRSAMGEILCLDALSSAAAFTPKGKHLPPAPVLRNGTYSVCKCLLSCQL